MSILDELDDKSKSKRHKSAMRAVVSLRERIQWTMYPIVDAVWPAIVFVGDLVEDIWEAVGGLIKFALVILFIWWVGGLILSGIDTLEANDEQRRLVTRYFEMYPDELRDSIADALKDDKLTIGEFILIEDYYEDLIEIDHEKLVARERAQWLEKLNNGLDENK